MPSKKARPKTQAPRDSVRAFERALAKDEADKQFELKLYVAGSGPLSAQAIECVNAVCQERLAGRYRLEVVDIHQQPSAIAPAQIVAAPTLVRQWPLPVRRFVGGLTSRERILNSLNLPPAPAKSA